MKVGINGFGRIGKNIYKILVKSGIDVPVVNDPFIDLEYLKYLLKHDSVFYGEGQSVEIEGDSVVYQGVKTILSRKKSPKDIPWKKYGIDYVIESSGVFLDAESCSGHKCKKVFLTAPSTDIKMYVYGVNHTEVDMNDKVISAASCTTNCLAPIAKLINDRYTIKEALMTTVHSLTATQSTVDSKGKKWRSSRSAFNIIPASTGAAKAVSHVIPELEGKIDGMAFRVPVQNASVVDLVVRVEKETSLQQIAEDIRKQSGVIELTTEEIVSSDIIGNSRSSIFDLHASIQLNPKFFKLICWYDNEHGYSCRVVDLVRYVNEKYSE